MRPKALLLERPRGLLTPVYCLVFALEFLTPLSQCGLFALNICTAPWRVEAWSPLLAKFGGMLRIPGPLGSIDRNDPSSPTLMASGAPKFDRLPTRIRFGSSIAPGWMNEGNLVGIGFAQAPGGGTFRKVPTCAMADAPGIFMATTRATMSVSSARAACQVASPSATAITAAKAVRLRTVCLLICLMNFPVGFARPA